MPPPVTIPNKTYRSRLQQFYASLALAVVAVAAVALLRSPTSAGSVEDEFAIGLTGARWSWVWWGTALLVAIGAIVSVRLWRYGVVIDDQGVTVHDHRRRPRRLPWTSIDHFEGGEPQRSFGFTFHRQPVAVLTGGERVDLEFGLRLLHVADPGLGLVARSNRRRVAELNCFLAAAPPATARRSSRWPRHSDDVATTGATSPVGRGGRRGRPVVKCADDDRRGMRLRLDEGGPLPRFGQLDSWRPPADGYASRRLGRLPVARTTTGCPSRVGGRGRG